MVNQEQTGLNEDILLGPVFEYYKQENSRVEFDFGDWNSYLDDSCNTVLIENWRESTQPETLQDNDHSPFTPEDGWVDDPNFVRTENGYQSADPETAYQTGYDDPNSSSYQTGYDDLNSAAYQTGYDDPNSADPETAYQASYDDPNYTGPETASQAGYDYPNSAAYQTSYDDPNSEEIINQIHEACHSLDAETINHLVRIVLASLFILPTELSQCLVDFISTSGE